MKLLGGTRHVQYGTQVIDYELVFTERKTLGIHVYPDSTVVVHAPLGSAEEALAALVLKRARWITQHQREFAQNAPESPLPRQYVSGEAYRYLGRQLRLKVIEGTVERVTLDRHYLLAEVRDPEDQAHIGELITRWFHRQAKRIFAERLAQCLPRVEAVGITPPEHLTIRDMKTRWGSCTPKKRILLNVGLIHVAPHLIDYVIVHELCHLKELNHSAAYYALLDKVMPDWRDRREALNRAELR